MGRGAAEDMSMPDLIRKMLGTLYSDSPAGSGKEIKGKEYNFEVYQNDKKVGVFKIDDLVLTPQFLRTRHAPVSARGLLYLDTEVDMVKEEGTELRGFIGDPKISVKITDVVFEDYAWGTPIVTNMEALNFEILAEEIKGK